MWINWLIRWNNWGQIRTIFNDAFPGITFPPVIVIIVECFDVLVYFLDIIFSVAVPIT
jgi:hypothetical protein